MSREHVMQCEYCGEPMAYNGRCFYFTCDCDLQRLIAAWMTQRGAR